MNLPYYKNYSQTFDNIQYKFLFLSSNHQSHLWVTKWEYNEARSWWALTEEARTPFVEPKILGLSLLPYYFLSAGPI